MDTNTAGPTKLALRRPHRKSRNGCRNCKVAHTKCDEARPSCTSCARWSRECVYTTAAPRRAAKQAVTTAPLADSSLPDSSAGNLTAATLSRDPQPASSSDASTPRHPPPGSGSSQWNSSIVPATGHDGKPRTEEETAVPSPTIASSTLHFTPNSLMDMELLHHYMSFTVQLAKESEKQKCWQNEVVQEALKYDFLLHAILAASAFDKATLTGTSDKEKYIETATYHQQAAISLSRPALENINAVNCHALTAFSMLMAVAAFVAPPDSQASGGKDPLKDILFIISLIRGVIAVLNTVRDQFELGPMKALTQVREAAAEHDLEGSTAEAFDRLADVLVFYPCAPSDHGAYMRTFNSLRQSFRKISRDRDDVALSQSDILLWLIQADQEYLNLLQQRTPMALAIFSYYTVMLAVLRGRFKFKEWADRLLGFLLDREEDFADLRGFLDWPREQVGLLRERENDSR